VSNQLTSSGEYVQSLGPTSGSGKAPINTTRQRLSHPQRYVHELLTTKNENPAPPHHGGDLRRDVRHHGLKQPAVHWREAMPAAVGQARGPGRTQPAQPSLRLAGGGGARRACAVTSRALRDTMPSGSSTTPRASETTSTRAPSAATRAAIDSLSATERTSRREATT
jgi:hypothetical protein